MKKLFEGIDELEFGRRFGDAGACYAFIAEMKWKDGFVCRKCGNDNYCRGRSPSSRRCTRCKHQESATAHTILHHCRIPVTEAFRIMYSVCCNPSISSGRLSDQEDIRRMTCWKFKKKILCWDDKPTK